MTQNIQQKGSFRAKISLALPVLILAIITIVICILRSDHRNQQENEILKTISSAEYEGLFCSMYPIENYPQEAFTLYRGLNVLPIYTDPLSAEDINLCLSEAFSSDNNVQTIYLGLDPAQIEQTDSFSKNLLSLVKKHPETVFEVLLPAPSMQYWLGHSETETDEILSRYQTLTSLLVEYSNVLVFFMGNEEWLISNPANYTGHMAFNEEISLHLALCTFCDRKYLLTSENTPILLAELSELIQNERKTPAIYPDLSHMDIVFFGDSIIGNYTNSSSVPDVISAFTGSRTYNCARGGTTATDDFITYVQAFLSADTAAVSADGPFAGSVTRYAQEDHSAKQLVFVLNYGLNDYFNGCPTGINTGASDFPTYADSLKQGIRLLQANYPDAKIILMTPTYTGTFSGGTEIQSEKGSILIDYVDAAKFVANEMNVVCLDNYTGLGVDANNLNQYTDDQLHLNEAGRFLLARRIIETLVFP